MLDAASARAQLTPSVAATQMGRGINLGNTLEPPQEGAWNNPPAEERYFDAYAEAGFQTVRIPVRWDQHTGSFGPYHVSDAWMARVEDVVDWALNRNLFVILNAHHEDWIKQNYGNAVFRARFDSIWAQVSRKFSDRSEKLMFEIINEPKGMTRENVDDLNARILSIIRRTNPTRIVMYSGNEYSNVDQLLAAAPLNDPYVMGYFHSYDPWQFAGLASGTWGTDADLNAMRDRIQRVATWSTSHHMPVVVSEFGAVHGADYNSRMRYYATYVEETLRAGIPFQVWDDGGGFGVLNRADLTWDDTNDILMHTFVDGPTSVSARVESDSTVVLAWENRTLQNEIRVQRATGNGAFADVATLPNSATTFTDANIGGGVTYRYRIIATNALAGDRFSYPVRITVPAYSRSNFLGSPFPVPGSFEAEDFDVGGDGLTYHDSDAINGPGGYRNDVGVDIEARPDGGYHVGFLEPGEWLEYTVDIASAGTYRVTAHVASLSGGGAFFFTYDAGTGNRMIVPQTGNWVTTEPVSETVQLNAGVQVIRFSVYTLPAFNIDRFDFELIAATSVETPPDQKESPTSDEVSLYPNPTRNSISVRLSAHSGFQTLTMFDLLGRIVRTMPVEGIQTMLDTASQPAGAYFIRLTGPEEQSLIQSFVKR